MSRQCHKIFRALIVLSLVVSGSAAQAMTLPPDAAEALALIESDAVASNSDSVLVMQGDRVLLEHYSSAGPRPLEAMSVTKSVVALAIGALITDRKIGSLDVPVYQFYPEWKQGRKQAITLRMLMNHTSGLQNVRSTAEEIYPAPDVLQLALAAELSHTPGEHFSYNNKAVNLLAGIVQIASGEPMDVYLQHRLFSPLMIEPGEWFKDSAGNPHAMSGLPLRARDAAKIGQLVLDRGQHRGDALLAPEFVDEMLAASKVNPEVGLLWWRRASWVRFHADADSISMLQRAGVSDVQLDKLRPLQGRSFANADELYVALGQALGEQWFEWWSRELIEPHGIGPWRPFHSEKGPIDTYEANGSMGQYIVIIPRVSLVAARQIESREQHAPEHDYANFTARVQALAALLEPSPASE